MKIMFYSFSNTFFFFNEVAKELKEKAEIAFIFPRGHYLRQSSKNVKKYYLYENFGETYKKSSIKNKTSLKKDNIYKIIECDKNETDNQGYKSLDKNEQLKLVNTIYKIYKKFLEDFEPDYIVFPDVETVDGNILINICYEMGIEVVYTVHLRQLGTSFFSNSIYETLPSYFGSYNSEDIKKATFLVNNFFSLSSVNFLRKWNDKTLVKIRLKNFFERIKDSLKLSYGKERFFRGEGQNFLYKVRTNLIYFVDKYRKFKFNNIHHRYFDIKTDQELDSLPKNFILFAMQVTPESSINSLEPYFIDQIRAIDLIRLNMPNDFHIIVKEHPLMIGLRNSDYYKKLRKKAGIILVSPYVNTKEVMKRAKLISTITGTIGLEGFIIDKPVLMFGSTFFSHLVKRYDSYLNLKQELEELIFNFKPLSKEEKIIEIAKLYNISYNFILFDPISNPETMEIENIKSFTKALLKHIERLNNV